MTFTGRAQVLIAWATEPFNPSPSWTDVTDWMRFDKGISLQRGRQDNISEIAAGRLTATADNSDGRFTAGRSTSPWAPVKMGRRIQVNVPDETGTLHTRFDGLIDDLPTAFDGGPGIESLADLTAADILAWLGRTPALLSWTQQEMLLDAPIALYSLADTSNVTQATDQAGQGALPLQIVSQGDGSGAASAAGGVPLTEIQTSDFLAQQQTVQTFTFTTPGPFDWPAPLGTLISCDVQCVAAGNAGITDGSGGGASGGVGAEYAEEPDLAVTPGSTYSGTVGTPGAPSGGSGTNTTFTGDSVTVTANASGSGSTNTVHHNGGSVGAGAGGASGGGGGGGSAGGQYQAGNAGVKGTATAGSPGGTAPAGGGAGGAGDFHGGGGAPGSAPGGGGGGGSSSAGGGGGAGQVTIIYTYVPPPADQQNSTLSSWLFTPSATLAARVLQGPLPQPVTAAAGFAAEIWAAFASFPAAAVTTETVPGPFTWTAAPGITTPDVACVAGGNAGTTGGGGGAAGGVGAEYAEEPALAVTPNNTYGGTVGTPGAPSAGSGADTTFAGDSVTVHAHASGSGSANTIHHNGGSAGGGAGGASGGGGGGGASGGQYQAGNAGVVGKATAGGTGGGAVTGGGAGGAGDFHGGGGAPGSAPGGGGGGGSSSAGAAGGAGQCVITATLAVSALLTLVNPRGRNAIAVWVTAAGHLQLASTAGYGTRSPTWTTVDAGQVAPSSEPIHVVIDVAATTGIATLYVNDVAAGTLTLPAGASYTWLTVGGSYAGWLGGWNGSAGLAAVYPAPLTSTRIGVHYTAGSTGFAGLSTGSMIAKIAAYVGLPSFYYTPPTGTSDPSYGLTLASYYDLNGQQALAQMQLYEQAEGGVLSVNAAGQLVFADRASRYAAGAAGSSFTLLAGQYEPDTSFKSNDQYLCTFACFATSAIPGGYPVTGPTYDDYGPYSNTNAGSLSSPQTAPFADATATAGTYSTDDLMDAGWWQVNVFGLPASRVPGLTVDLLTLPASEFSIASFYGTDIGSAVKLAGLPSQAPDVTGSPLGAYEVIEGVNETIDLNSHTAQLYTSPLAQNAAWIAGDSLLGVLGATTVVGRSQAPAVVGPPYTPVPTFGSTLNRTGSVGAQDLRTLTVNVQDRLTPPLAIGQQQNAQTLTTLTGQAVTWDTLLADTAGGFGSLATYTVQAGFAGYYLCTAVVQAATGTSSLSGIAAWFLATLSGTASQWGAKAVPYLSSAPYTSVAIAQRIGPCNPGDTIQVLAAAAGSPASLPLGTADGGSMFTLLWQGD